MTDDLLPEITNRRWIMFEHPFPHVVADDVFTPAFYATLVEAVQSALSAEGLAYAGEHDTTVRPVKPSDNWPLRFFYSEAWQLLLTRLFKLPAVGPALGKVTCAIHHHEVGSADGFPHNDLPREWFISEPQSQGGDSDKRHVCVRGVAVLIYLANEQWQSGDGGETALYRSAHDPVQSPVCTVAPINNRLLAFPCSPVSYHAFLSNRYNPRRSIVMWTYQRRKDLLTQWQGGIGGI